MTMNFSELQPGANFYVISTNGGLQVAVGTVKGKTAPYWPTPNPMNSQLIDLTVNIGGQDRVVPGLPISLEVAGRDPEIYTGNRETAERRTHHRRKGERSRQDSPESQLLQETEAGRPQVQGDYQPRLCGHSPTG